MSEDLVAEMRGGDLVAFESLYERYSQIVYRVALRISQSTRAAEAICEDVFTALWRSRDAYCALDVAGWLLRTTRSKALAAANKQHGHDVDLGTVALDTSARKNAGTAISALRAEERSALELAFFDGMTYEDIASRTGEPGYVIKTRIVTGLRSLRAALARP